jgi:hypothetical protein
VPITSRAFALAAVCTFAFVTLAFGQQPSSPKSGSGITPPDGPEGTSIYDSLTFNPDRKKPAKKALEARGKRFAVCVGVGQASANGIVQDPLPMCINDATRLGEILAKAGYQAHVLTDDAVDASNKPSVANVMRTMDDVCAAAGHDDQIVLYFSTHGGIDESRNNKPVLVLADGLIDLETIKQKAAGSSALVRIVMLDACRVEGSGFRTETNECRDVHVILACRPDQESNGGKLGLSIFTEALINGLTDCAADRIKDGRIELDELLYYIEDAMPALLERDWPGTVQNPTRTVVDPRAINPVMLVCPKPADETTDEDEANVVGVFEPTVSSLLNDLILTSGTAGRVTLGMTVAEVQAAMAEQMLGLEYGSDPNADDLAMYENYPKAGDSFYIFFKAGHVARVMVMEANPCNGTFDREEACRGVRRLTGGAEYDKWSDLFAGLSKDQVRALMGCPTEAIVGDAIRNESTWFYRKVPVMLLDTVLHFEGDRVVSVDVDPAKE